jgi:hypothetical protein
LENKEQFQITEPRDTSQLIGRTDSQEAVKGREWVKYGPFEIWGQWGVQPMKGALPSLERSEPHYQWFTQKLRTECLNTGPSDCLASWSASLLSAVCY